MNADRARERGTALLNAKKRGMGIVNAASATVSVASRSAIVNSRIGRDDDKGSEIITLAQTNDKSFVRGSSYPFLPHSLPSAEVCKRWIVGA